MISKAELKGEEMSNTVTDISPRTAALVSGLALLTMVIAAPFAFMTLTEKLIVPGDAAMTVSNILANVGQFRVAIAAFLLVTLCDLLVAWGLYELLKQVNQGLSMLAAWLRVMHATIFACSVVFLLLILQFMSAKDDLQVFDPKPLHAMVLPLSQAFNYGYLIGQMFFAFHLMVLGYLAIKSGFVPKLLGILLFIGGTIGYLIDSSCKLFIPDLAVLAYPGLAVGTVAEIWLLFWLLTKGGKSVQS